MFKPNVPTKLDANVGSNDVGCRIDAPYPTLSKTDGAVGPTLSAVVSDKTTSQALSTRFFYWQDGQSTHNYTDASPTADAKSRTASIQLSPTFIQNLPTKATVDWQVRTWNGMTTSDGSNRSTWGLSDLSPICHFNVDKLSPDAPTIADNLDGQPAAPNSTISFTFTENTVDPAAKFVWGVDVPPATVNPPASHVVTATTKPDGTTTATVNVTATTDGSHRLYVYAVDANTNSSGTAGHYYDVNIDPGQTYDSFSAAVNNAIVSDDSKPALMCPALSGQPIDG